MENALQRIDILDRQQFVDDVVKIIRQLSANKKNTTFAINGAWGVGKTFVLDMLEEQLKDDFIVFHYNAWEYDYYDEPLVALLTLTIKQIEEMMKNEIAAKKVDKAVLKKVKNALVGFVGEISRNKLGVDIPKLIKEISEDVSNQTKASKAYNPYLDITETIGRVKAQLSQLSEKAPIVFVVDEMDRCLPEYAIKILERLHHVLSGIDDLQVILSVDKVQVEKTVRTIFGDQTDVDHYLQKFIQFTIDLPIGIIVYEKWKERFADYQSRFVNFGVRKAYEEDATFYIEKLFAREDMRTRIEIVDKAFQLHDLLLDKTKRYEVVYMLLELSIVIGQRDGIFRKSGYSVAYRTDDPREIFHDSEKLRSIFQKKVIEKYKGQSISDPIVKIRFDNIWGVLWYALCIAKGGEVMSKTIYINDGFPLGKAFLDGLFNYADKFQKMCAFLQ